MGTVIGVSVLVTPNISDAKWNAGLGLVGTAIAGAAGLAQGNKNEQDFSVRQQGDKLQVQTPASDSNSKE